ncbi:alkaline phosphatase family protein [Porphyromonas sp.]|uniref:alkaline phosphatase family protein n=1 Tax=Porphyromonas sp. TaxID=1924944 RepID=UPI0026DDCAF5|nr:alkaline phosphatase family protein [Porphyromonas sp.]MDO4695276.1 alkaline phosphatase family protein [Porphyromonas sp.]MDO4770686.1 alkaline phosphatase family protein [Porphyromonas sp.]
MNKLIVPIIALLTMCQTQVEANIPRLVVLLSVEELRSDILDEIYPLLPEGGLKKLIDEGQVYSNVKNPILSADPTASHAMLHTGTTAFANGIATRRPNILSVNGKVSSYNSVFHDEQYIGYATSTRLSPKRLSAPTIADKLWQATGGDALIYSLAPNAEEAIIGGGQHADGVFWIDDYNGKWVSSTYYKEGYPSYMYKLNEGSESLLNRLKNSVWLPSVSGLSDRQGLSPYISKTVVTQGFKHNFDSNGEGIAKFKKSALVNEEVMKAVDIIFTNTEIGKDDVPDFLALNLFAGNHAEATRDITPELFDTYYRLDRAIASLLGKIDGRTGSSQTLIALVGNGQSREFHSRDEIIGYFHNDRCKALMNVFIMAQYGQGNWVEEVTNDGQIFLNRKLIESQKLNLQDVQSKTADFLRDFSGIQYAITDHELRERAVLDSQDNSLFQSCLNRATIKERGDVLFELLPSWAFIRAENLTDSGLYRYGTAPTTFILRSADLRSQKIAAPLDIRDISATICYVLRIRPPTQGRSIGMGVFQN